MYSKSSPLRSWLTQVSTVSLLISAMGIQAAPPGWWSAGSPPVVNSSPENNKGMANVGQAKWVAQSALEALEDVLGENSSVVQSIEAELFKVTENAPEGVFFPGRPLDPSVDWLEAQKAPLRIGALKALAAPFYKHLSDFDPVWMEDQLHDNGLLVEGTNYFEDADGTLYPWNPADNQNSEKNSSVAAIGQLKAVFSLRFEELVFNTDRDGDGLSNTAEELLGTDPDNADSDWDGMPDGWEVEWALNPLDSADAYGDPDQDLVTNLREYQTSTLPTGLYRMQAVALDTGANEHLAGTGPDGSLHLERDGNVLSLSGSTLATGKTSDWLAASLPPAARGRAALPLGTWQTTGSTLQSGSTAFQLAADSKVRLQYRYKQTNSSGTTVLADDCFFVERDPVAGTHTFAEWDDICADLHAGGYLSAATAPVPEALIASPQGNRILFNTGTRHLMLDQAGAFVAELPASATAYGVNLITWKAVNNLGDAVGIGMPGSKLVSWRTARPLTSEGVLVWPTPTEWGASTWTYKTRLTDDSRIVIERGLGEFHKFHTDNGQISPITLPGTSSTLPEAVVDMNDGGRILGSGDVPWTSADGMNLKIENLRITGTNPGDPSLKFSAAGLTGFTPVEISTNGTISGEATMPGTGAVVVQLIPVSDNDGDGVNDDYERAFAAYLEDTYKIDVPNDPAQFNTLNDYPNTGRTAAEEYATGKKAPALLAASTWTTDYNWASVAHAGLSTTNPPAGTSLPRAKYYKKSVFTRSQISSDDGAGETTTTNRTHKETREWTRSSSAVPYEDVNGPYRHLHMFEWTYKWIFDGNWTNVVDYDAAPGEDADKTTYSASYSNLIPDMSSGTHEVDETVTTVSVEPPNPPVVTRKAPLYPEFQPGPLPFEEEVDWLDEEETLLDSYVDPEDTDYTITKTEDDPEFEHYDDYEGTRKWELLEGEDWRTLAGDAFQAAQSKKKRDLDRSGYLGILGISGGIGGHDQTGSGASTTANYEEATWTFRGGSVPQFVYIRRTSRTLAAGKTWASMNPTEEEPSVTETTTMEVKVLKADGHLQIQRSTLPATGEDWVSYQVGFLPMDVGSMDRYLAGSISDGYLSSLGGDTKVGLEFRNGSETYTYSALSDAYIYTNPHTTDQEEGEDAFFNAEEITKEKQGTAETGRLDQDVVFYRENGSLHFRALFDNVGEIEIGILIDGEEIGTIPWTLHSDSEVADLLETTDSILSSGGGEVILGMAAQSGLDPEDLQAMEEVASQEQTFTEFNGFFLNRNYTIKVHMPTWEELGECFMEGAKIIKDEVEREVTMVAVGGKGFVEGAWFGIVDDVTSIIELVDMVLHPAETAKMLREGLKVLVGLDWNGWKNVGKTLMKSFINKGEEGAGEWVEPNNFNVAAYLVGFTAGFIVEQIVVTYITAGILKAGNIGAKIGKFLRMAAKGLKVPLEAAAKLKTLAMKTKNSLFRAFSQHVDSIEDVQFLKKTLQELELGCPAT